MPTSRSPQALEAPCVSLWTAPSLSLEYELAVWGVGQARPPRGFALSPFVLRRAHPELICHHHGLP